MPVYHISSKYLRTCDLRREYKKTRRTDKLRMMHTPVDLVTDDSYSAGIYMLDSLKSAQETQSESADWIRTTFYHSASTDRQRQITLMRIPDTMAVIASNNFINWIESVLERRFKCVGSRMIYDITKTKNILDYERKLDNSNTEVKEIFE